MTVEYYKAINVYFDETLCFKFVDGILVNVAEKTKLKKEIFEESIKNGLMVPISEEEFLIETKL